MVVRRKRKPSIAILDTERADTLKQLKEAVENAKQLRADLQNGVSDLSKIIGDTESLISQLSYQLSGKDP